MTRTISRAQVKVILGDNVAVLEPALPWLRSRLTYRESLFEVGGLRGYRRVEREVASYLLDHKDRLAFPLGLLPRILSVLDERGYRVEVHDLCEPSSTMIVDEGVFAQADKEDVALFHALTDNALGQIQVRNLVEALHVSAFLVALFPQAQVIVALPTRRLAWKWWRLLTKHLGQSIGLAAGGTHRKSTRVLVCTLGNIPLGEDGQWDVLLLPCPQESCGDQAVEAIVAMGFRRIYALVTPTAALDARIRLRLESMAGPVILTAADNTTRVRVLTIPVSQGRVQADSGTTPLERKRAFCWHHRPRNLLIAAVARALADGNLKTLRARGLRLREQDVMGKTIVVLTETVEHARALMVLLPGVALRSAVAGAGPTVRARLAVMTAVYAATEGIDADVLLYAPGGARLPSVRGFPLTVRGTGAHEALLVDFLDDYDTRAAQDVARRLEDYERRGWMVPAPPAR